MDRSLPLMSFYFFSVAAFSASSLSHCCNCFDQLYPRQLLISRVFVACISTYFRLGYQPPGSGLRAHVSRSALNFHVMATMAVMTAPAMMVLPFQLAGWAYQPPAGDQTCLGYLRAAKGRQNRPITSGGFYSRSLAIGMNLRDLRTTTLI